MTAAVADVEAAADAAIEVAAIVSPAGRHHLKCLVQGTPHQPATEVKDPVGLRLETNYCLAVSANAGQSMWTIHYCSQQGQVQLPWLSKLESPAQYPA